MTTVRSLPERLSILRDAIGIRSHVTEPCRVPAAEYARRVLRAPSPDSWLPGLLRQHGPTTWTGRGASHAVASAMAASCFQLGADARVAPADEALVGDVVLVSQSGTSAGVTAKHVLAASGPFAETWFPCSWVRESAGRFAAAMGLGMATRPLPVESSPRDVLLLVPRDAEPLRLLLRAARHKLGQPIAEATSFDEFGHGLHAQVALAPARWRIGVVLGPGELEDPAVAVWLAARGCVIEPLAAEVEPGSAAALPLARLMRCLDVIESVARGRGLNLDVRPIPREHDGLRTGGGMS